MEFRNLRDHQIEELRSNELIGLFDLNTALAKIMDFALVRFGRRRWINNELWYSATRRQYRLGAAARRDAHRTRH